MRIFTFHENLSLQKNEETHSLLINSPCIEELRSCLDELREHLREMKRDEEIKVWPGNEKACISFYGELQKKMNGRRVT